MSKCTLNCQKNGENEMGEKKSRKKKKSEEEKNQTMAISMILYSRQYTVNKAEDHVKIHPLLQQNALSSATKMKTRKGGQCQTYSSCIQLTSELSKTMSKCTLSHQKNNVFLGSSECILTRSSKVVPLKV